MARKYAWKIQVCRQKYRNKKVKHTYNFYSRKVYFRRSNSNKWKEKNTSLSVKNIFLNIYMILHILPRSPVIICELVIFTGLGTLLTLDMALFTAVFSISNFGVEISSVFELFSVFLTIGLGCFGVCRRTERRGSGLPPIFWSKFRRILPRFMGAGVPIIKK